MVKIGCREVCKKNVLPEEEEEETSKIQDPAGDPIRVRNE